MDNVIKTSFCSRTSRTIRRCARPNSSTTRSTPRCWARTRGEHVHGGRPRKTGVLDRDRRGRSGLEGLREEYEWNGNSSRPAQVFLVLSAAAVGCLSEVSFSIPEGVSVGSPSRTERGLGHRVGGSGPAGPVDEKTGARLQDVERFWVGRH